MSSGRRPSALAMSLALTLIAGCARERPTTSSGAPPSRNAPPYGNGSYPPGQPGPPSPAQAPAQGTPPAAADVGQDCVDSINRHRATQQLAPLARWREGEACAVHEAQLDSLHDTPHGSFGSCNEMAQNVCPGWDGPAAKITEPCVQDMWNEGPGADYQAHGHYLNMSDRGYRAVACGYFTLPNGKVWLIQNYTR